MHNGRVAFRVKNLHLGNLVAPQKGNDARGHHGRRALLPTLEARDVSLIGANGGSDRRLGKPARDSQPPKRCFHHPVLHCMDHTHVCQARRNASSALHRSMCPSNVLVVDYDEWLKLLGSNVRRRRLLMDMTQAQLGDASGSDQGGISRLENGEQGFMGDTFFAIAAQLQCEPWQLLHPEFHPQILPEAMTPAASLELHELRQFERLHGIKKGARAKETPTQTVRPRRGSAPTRVPDRKQPSHVSPHSPAPRKTRA